MTLAAGPGAQHHLRQIVRAAFAVADAEWNLTLASAEQDKAKDPSPAMLAADRLWEQRHEEREEKIVSLKDAVLASLEFHDQAELERLLSIAEPDWSKYVQPTAMIVTDAELPPLSAEKPLDEHAEAIVPGPTGRAQPKAEDSAGPPPLHGEYPAGSGHFGFPRCAEPPLEQEAAGQEAAPAPAKRKGRHPNQTLGILTTRAGLKAPGRLGRPQKPASAPPPAAAPQTPTPAPSRPSGRPGTITHACGHAILSPLGGPARVSAEPCRNCLRERGELVDEEAKGYQGHRTGPGRPKLDLRIRRPQPKPAAEPSPAAEAYRGLD